MSVPFIDYDVSTGRWLDERGNEFAISSAPLAGIVFEAAPWEKIMCLAPDHADLRAMLRGAMQAGCKACGGLVVLSRASQAVLRERPSSTILCGDCAGRLQKMASEREGRE